ncbi:MAG: copper-binding protein, partial [Ponticaulis sp.]|nr:copper-binding protein [Ponticaulis sp.]
MINRRRFLTYSAGLAGMSSILPAWARSASNGNLGIPALQGTNFDLHVSEFPFQVNGKTGRAVGVNGTVPAPL